VLHIKIAMASDVGFLFHIHIQGGSHGNFILPLPCLNGNRKAPLTNSTCGTPFNVSWDLAVKTLELVSTTSRSPEKKDLQFFVQHEAKASRVSGRKTPSSFRNFKATSEANVM